MPSPTAIPSSVSPSNDQIGTPWRSLATLVGVFFFWGFVAASNDILIPVFKQALNLEQWQSQMISFAFYVAYTLGSLLYLLASSLWAGKEHGDLIRRWGYSRSLSYGLLLSAAGTLLFIPAANQASFSLLLAGLMVVGLGFSLQQTVANPLVIRMGPQDKGAQRLSMAGGVNNLGTTLGPLLVSYAIFGPMGQGEASSGQTMNLVAVQTPYLVLGMLFVLAAGVFYFKDMGRPEAEETKDSVAGEDASVAGSAAGSATGSAAGSLAGSVFALPQVWGGMLAIFLYVGVEVATASNLPEYLRHELQMPVDSLAPYVALFWASLMVGRWTGTASLAQGTWMGFSGEQVRWLMRVGLALLAFGVYLLVTFLGGHDPSLHFPYLAAIAVLVLGDAFSGGKADRQLALYSVLGILFLILGIYAPAGLGVYALAGVGLFCSTLWPCIFTLALRDMGSATTKVSSALIMMIMGGGWVSLIQGVLADESLWGIRASFWVGVFCFAYLVVYALFLSKRGIGEKVPIPH